MAFKVKKKVCPICGTEFETAKPNKKYCGLSCREAGEEARRLRWEAVNKTYHAEYMRKYRAAQKEKAEQEQETETQARKTLGCAHV